MPAKWITADRAPIDFAAIRRDLGIPAEYPADAVADAQQAHPPAPPRDATGIPLVTIDPPGSMDLDQAMHLERAGRGYRVHYAIADVAAFVAPGGALDAETRRRGQTLYSPDIRTPLHPDVMGEGTASLLPDLDRPAVLWTIELDERGEPVKVGLGRATVRSVARLDYAEVQAAREVGQVHPSVALLGEIGELRRAAARRRHAIDLGIADAEVVPVGRTDESGTGQSGTGPIGHRRCRSLDTGTPGRTTRGEGQRRDQPAHRDVRGLDHGQGPGRGAADAAAAGPATDRCAAPIGRLAAEWTGRMASRPGT